MEKKRIRRKQYLIKPKFQLKHAGFNLIVLLLACLTFGFIIYKSGTITMITEITRIYPEKVPWFIMKLVLKQVLFTVLIFLPVVLAGSVYLSHKIAGPAYRMEKDIKKITEGEFGLRIRIRKGDELQKLVNEINGMVESTGNMVMKIKNSTKKMQDSVRGELDYARSVMEHIHADIEHIKTDHLKEHRECKFVPELSEHVKDLDNHLHEILAHVEKEK